MAILLANFWVRSYNPDIMLDRKARGTDSVKKQELWAANRCHG
jgi:hypothetical protein